MSKTTIVFDIDETLANAISQRQFNTLDSRFVAFFEKVSTIIWTHGAAHFVFPGVLEMMRWLYSHPEVGVVFFSAGLRKRNQDFVKALLIKSLGEDEFHKICSNVKIFSREDLKNTSSHEHFIQFRTFGIPWPFHQPCKKDMSLVREDRDIRTTVFVDNSPANVFPGQESNYLFVPTVTLQDFFHVFKDTDDSETIPAPLDTLLSKKTNIIFYLCGQLSDCIESKYGVRTVLFNRHFKRREDQPIKFNQEFHQAWSNEAFYYLGLSILKIKNPNLAFISREYFQAAFPQETIPKENSAPEDVQLF